MLIEEQDGALVFIRKIPMTKEEYGNLLQTSEFGKIKDNIFEVQDNGKDNYNVEDITLRT